MANVKQPAWRPLVELSADSVRQRGRGRDVTGPGQCIVTSPGAAFLVSSRSTLPVYILLRRARTTGLLVRVSKKRLVVT
eukprot:295077-Rhodomonas_salina.2